MNSSDIFEILIDKRHLALSCSSRPESLRIWLVKKFKNYKSDMDKLGFLDPELEPLSLSLQWDEESKTANFYLRARKGPTVTYTLLCQENMQPSGSN